MSDEDDLFIAAMQATAAGNTRKARHLLRRAADSEHLPAMMTYVAYVEHGVGGNPDENKALPYYRRAAVLGDATACLRVAQWHIDRGQVPQAKAWLHMTCSNRVRLAEIRLDLKSRSCRTTSRVNARLWRFHVEPEALTALERIEVEALIAAYKKRHPNVANAQAGRDKMREAKRRQQEKSDRTL